MSEEVLNVKLIEDISAKLQFAGPKMRSLIAREINKAITSGRKEIVEDMMVRTKMKRKVFNDRMIISRASPDRLEGRVTPIYGKRVYMTFYPFEEVSARNGRKAIRLSSPLYRKNMRTGFMSQDNSRMYLRVGAASGSNNGKGSVRAVWGRSIPRLFEQFKYKEGMEAKLANEAFENLSKNLLVDIGL